MRVDGYLCHIPRGLADSFDVAVIPYGSCSGERIRCDREPAVAGACIHGVRVCWSHRNAGYLSTVPRQITGDCYPIASIVRGLINPVSSKVEVGRVQRINREWRKEFHPISLVNPAHHIGPGTSDSARSGLPHSSIGLARGVHIARRDRINGSPAAVAADYKVPSQHAAVPLRAVVLSSAKAVGDVLGVDRRRKVKLSDRQRIIELSPWHGGCSRLTCPPDTAVVPGIKNATVRRKCQGVHVHVQIETVRSLGHICPMQSTVHRPVYEAAICTAHEHFVGIGGSDCDRLVVPTLLTAVVRSVDEFHPVCTAVRGLEKAEQPSG